MKEKEVKKRGRDGVLGRATGKARGAWEAVVAQMGRGGGGEGEARRVNGRSMKWKGRGRGKN